MPITAPTTAPKLASINYGQSVFVTELTDPEFVWHVAPAHFESLVTWINANGGPTFWTIVPEDRAECFECKRIKRICKGHKLGRKLLAGEGR